MNQAHENSNMRSTDLRSAAHAGHGTATTATSAFGRITWSFLKFAVGRWWRVATPVGVLLAAIASSYIYFVMGPAYEAEAWIRIEDMKPSLAFQHADSPRFVNTQIELIRSPMVLNAVISQPEIAKLPEIANVPAPLPWLAARLTARPVGGSELYKLVFETPYSENAALICNAVLDSYLKIQSEFSDAQV